MDSSNTKLKLSAEEWDTFRAGIFNEFFVESIETHDKLKKVCEKRAYNGEYATFFTKDNFSQNFVIQTINGKLKLPGIVA